MTLRHIVVATDDSETGHHAVRVAAGLAIDSRCRLTVLTAIASAPPAPPVVQRLEGSGSSKTPAELNALRSWLTTELGALVADADVSVALAYGLPGIEIPRFAEDQSADLLVMGRQRRSREDRLVTGDTADAVVRRSRVPCLFVPAGSGEPFHHVLVALDGTERGLDVFRRAVGLTAGFHAELRAVTVERHLRNEPPSLAAGTPSARSVRLAERLGELARQLRFRRRAESQAAPGAPLLAVRHGDPAQEILAELARQRAETLAIGFRRGGPPAVIDAGSVARTLVHGAPTATLTVPL